MAKEMEHKFLVREDELDFIETFLISNTNSYQSLTQTNYYYDTDDYLFFRSGLTCRIRYYNGKLIGTLKIHRNNTSNENIELVFDINNITNSLSISDIDLYLLGSVTTSRKIFELSNGITVMLDKNSYLGNTDFEVEIEYTKQNEARMKEFLSELDNLLLQYCIMIGHDMSSVYETSEHKSTRLINAKKKFTSYNNISLNVKEKQ